MVRSIKIEKGFLETSVFFFVLDCSFELKFDKIESKENQKRKYHVKRVINLNRRARWCWKDNSFGGTFLPVLEKVYPAQVVTTREPGGVAIAEQIREVILDVDNTAMDAKTELLLYIAARRQHLIEKVLPELEKGNMVIMDRFIDSSVAYQGLVVAWIRMRLPG